MDVQSGYPYWAIKNGLMTAFPPLRNDARCEVAVIGGGITAAIMADRLVADGFDVMVVEQCEMGWGSTAASTALLQYEIDTPMIELARRYGEPQAALAYRSCAQAIQRLEELAADIGGCEFRRQDSLYLASRRWHVRRMREEYELRRVHGLDVQWLLPGDIVARYGFDAEGAILSSLAARCDPYRMTSRLLARVRRNGGTVHGNTQVASIEGAARSACLHMADGVRLRADHVVVAAGYAGQCWLKAKVASNRSTYAFVSHPLDAGMLKPIAGTLVWESARPYLYLRTADGRLMVGGEDDAIDIASRRDRRVPAKAETLARRTRRMLPGMTIEPAFAWAGTFAETKDGLPFFGPHPEYGPRVHFAMAYGGNGITFAVLGADVVLAAIRRRSHPLRSMFSFERLR